MDVMEAMMRRPPQRSALHRRATDPSEQELGDAAGLKRAMREIAVVKGGEREDAQGVEESRDADCRPTPPDPNDAQAHQVDDRVGNHPRPIEALIRMIDRNSRGLLGEKPTTEAAKDGPRLR